MSTTITEITGLQAMENDLSEDYVLGNDIDAILTTVWNADNGGYYGFDPIGDNSTPFTGTFDGAGFTITDLYINRPTEYYCGLFGYITTATTITDVGIVDCDITGGRCTGALVGYNGDGTNVSAISDCYSTGDVKASGVGWRGCLGGLVGYNKTASTITDCYSTATITVTVTPSSAGANTNQIGGLIGSNDSVATGSYATGDITITVTGADDDAGEIGGFAGDSLNGTQTNCYSTGDITITCDARIWNVGGFAGEISIYDADSSRCYSTGDIDITAGEDITEVGGFTGYAYDSFDNCYSRGAVAVCSSGLTSHAIGGFVGSTRAAKTIEDCYSTGLITTTGTFVSVGGFCGENNGTVTTSFWDTETSGKATSDGGTGKTTAQMKTESTFTGWDFVDIWGIDADYNNGYPDFLGKGQYVEAQTNPATRIEKTTARLNGEVVNDDGEACEYRFRHREAFVGASWTNTSWTGSKETDETFYEDITGLTEDKTYQFAAQIKNATATSAWGSTLYFTCGTRSKTIGPVYDSKGRVPKGARVEARRADTGVVAETEYLDSSGKATFDDLPNDTDVTFWGTWGGTTQALKTEQFFSTIIGVTEGGTGSSDAEAARANLGVGIDDSPQFEEINLGHTTDTTLARESAGKVSIEGTVITRAANYIVAANDAPTHFKAQADRTCNGTNDHVEIQAVIDLLPATGGKVLLSPGTFNIETTVALDTNQTLQGCGKSTILTTTTYLNIISSTGSSGSEKTGVVVADLQVDGADNSDTGVLFEYTDDSLIQNVYAKDHYGGSVMAGIILSNSDFNIVVNCLSTGSLAGIEISTGTNNVISNNTCKEGDTGIWLADADYNIVSDNICQGNNNDGIYLASSDHNTIEINSCLENSQGTTNTDDDILLYASDYNNIQGNTCRAGDLAKVPRYGINISNANCDGNKVINNDLYDDGFGTAPYNDSGTGTIYLEPEDTRDFLKYFGNRTLFSGGVISAHGDADGSVAIASCTAWSKETDSDTADGVFFSYAGKAKQTLTDLSVNLIYLDYNAGTPQIVVATTPVTYGFQQDHILMGVVFRQGTATHIFQSSNIGIQGINRAFMHAVEHFGAHRSSGLVTSDGGSLALSITAGIIYAGLNRQATTVDGSTWSYWYTDDSGTTWHEDTSISALVQSYNNIASGKVSLGSNKFGVHWVYVDYEGSHVHIVYGQGNYTAPQAEATTVPSVLPPIVVGYGVLIAKIINQEGTDTLTITYPWTTVFTSSLATDHGSLAGLLDDDHTQYLQKGDIIWDAGVVSEELTYDARVAFDLGTSTQRY